MKTKNLLLALLLSASVLSLAVLSLFSMDRNKFRYLVVRIPILRRFFKPTVETALSLYGEPARGRLQKLFTAKAVPYPPKKIAYIALKSEKRLLVYASSDQDKFKYICSYPILGASGTLGPKLREGDFQVPEGIYNLTLEPDTPYHVALRLDYPNASDLLRAKSDHRDNPGNNILMHGTTGSVGCIAMGDQVSEDLFVLAFDTYNNDLPLIIAPVDLRVSPAPNNIEHAPSWLNELYSEVSAKLHEFPPADN